MNTKRQFSAAFKAKRVPQILRTEPSINQLAAEHGIHPHQLYLASRAFWVLTTGATLLGAGSISA